MTPSKAHPYLVSFSEARPDHPGPGDRSHDLGEAALQIGLSAAVQRLSPLRIAQEELKKVGVAAQYSTAVSVWGNLGPTIVQFTEAGPSAACFASAAAPCCRCCTRRAGLVFATYMPRSKVLAALKGERHRYAGRPGTVTPAQLDALTAEVRRLGISRNIGEVVPGVNLDQRARVQRRRANSSSRSASHDARHGGRCRSIRHHRPSGARMRSADLPEARIPPRGSIERLVPTVAG